MKKLTIPHIILGMGILLTILSFFSCQPSGPVRRILIVQSYEPEYTGYKSIEEKTRKAFKKENIQTDIRIFYLDCENYRDNAEKERIYLFLDTIQQWNPEVILVNDDQATYSLLACGHPLVKKTPIVFAGVNFPNWELIKQYPNITGGWDKLEFMPLVRMTEQMFGPKRMRCWLDDTFLGRSATYRLLEELNEQGITHLGAYSFTLKKDGTYTLQMDSAKIDRREGIMKIPPHTTEFTKLDPHNSQSATLLWSVSSLSPHSLYVLCKRSFTSIRIGLFANSPTLSVINDGFGTGEGILGGYFTPIDTQINLSVHTVVEILNGKNVKDIPIIETPKKYMIDWTEIERWNIPSDAIPPGCTIVNMPFTKKYKTPLIIGGSVIGLAILVLIGYLLHLYRRESRKKRQAEENLRKEERFLALALEGGKVFAFQIKDGFFYFNSAFYSTVGIEERPISMEEFRAILIPVDRPSFNQQISSALNGSVLQRIGQGRYNFNGSGYQWWEFRYAYSEEDQIICGLCLNIQELKEAETELIQARQKAEESDKMKSAFLANMSHEIRTPLNAIVGFSNLITTEDMNLSSGEKQEFLELINTNCELLLKLINDILDLSRIESGRMDFNFNSYNLTDLMNNIYHTHQLLMPPGVELQVRIPENPLFLKTDRHRLTQVLTNFINNAAKFTEAGYIRIGYELAPDGQGVHLYVEDTGKGIPKEQQKAVFERFNKLDEFAQGTGLGLAICKVIVQRFQGSIHLQSTEGLGSRFTVILPFIH